MSLGLQYKKLDLHVHTKASHDFNGEVTPQDIVQMAIEKGLDAIAITDHNTVEWIDEVIGAAKETSLTIFPGIEISCTGGEHGIHVIAIFDVDKDAKYLVGFLGALGITPEEYGKPDSLIEKNVIEVIDLVHKWNGLTILAHANSSKGVIHDMKGEQRTRIIQNPFLLAVEATDFDKPVGKRTIDFLNGKDAVYKRKLAVFQSSDNRDVGGNGHNLESIGSRFSYFKLDKINLEGLRQCFIHPEARIATELRVNKHNTIKSLKVSNHGFLKNQKFEFHEGLNSVIGGKGVGKSLAIELLRFGLHDTSSNDDLLKDHASKLSKQFGEDGTTTIEYQLSNGTIYEITRKLNQINEIEIDSATKCVRTDTGEEYQGDIKEMFPILAYSQTEVIKISENKDAQLELIDKFIDKRLVLHNIEEISEKLRQNDRRYSNALLAESQLQQCNLEVNTISEKIKVIDKALANELFDDMKKAEAKHKALMNNIEAIEQIAQKVNDLINEINDISNDQLESTDPDILSSEKLFTQSKNNVILGAKIIVDKLNADKLSTENLLNNWLPYLMDIQTKYNLLVDSLGGDKQKSERERQRLEIEKSELDEKLQQLKKEVGELDAIKTEREELINQLESQYLTYYELRKQKFDEITALSDGRLSLSLEHSQNRAVYAETLVDLLKGGGNAVPVPQRKQLAEKISPRRLVDLVLAREVVTIENEAGLTAGLAQKVVEKLWSHEDFSEVLAVQHNCYPEDIPQIQFQKGDNVFDELSSLSVGQKCTALLIIALVEGNHPVIIDQPEDALDVVSVWEDIAKKLIGRKNFRQFILTTHNSSVAVAADSDQYIILQSNATEGQISIKGAIDRDEVKNSVISHLEGGSEPYNLKRKKYNRDID
jgi:hypothetical protein